MNDHKEEYLDIIDSINNVIGTATRLDSYKQKLPHRIVHVMVEDRGRYFIVRRSLRCRYLPGHFCSSAGGHVAAGENVEAAALREMEEEIGLSGPIELFREFYFTHEFRIHISLFIKRFDSASDIVKLNEDEVLEGRFCDPDEIRNLDRSLFHPQFTSCLEQMGIL